ncbi:MAG: CoA pyrophosphatase [Nannocystaceae bacterium]
MSRTPIDLSLATVQARLASHDPREPIVDVLSPRRAAVAALLRYRDQSPEVLLMERAARPGDRWSGQISFPGGREEERDRDARATAIRETEEEVGLALERCAALLGRLDGVQAMARGVSLPLVITPFVFVQTEPAALALGPEAASTFWLPLEPAAAGALDDVYPYRLGPVRMKLPCFHHEGRVIWGLTYRMLRDLLDVVGARPK